MQSTSFELAQKLEALQTLHNQAQPKSISSIHGLRQGRQSIADRDKLDCTYCAKHTGSNAGGNKNIMHACPTEPLHQAISHSTECSTRAKQIRTSCQRPLDYLLYSLVWSGAEQVVQTPCKLASEA
jgi:hypothetical protein